MTAPNDETPAEYPAAGIDARLRRALGSPSSSDRLQAALAAGTHPNPGFVDALVERCSTEPDFYVRDMLTWALTRHPTTVTVPRLLRELARDASAQPTSHRPDRADDQARSQALHSLSKIRDPAGWTAITAAVLNDPNDDVARTAWRAAVVLVPASEEEALAHDLAGQLGRGDSDVRRSLGRSLAALGESARTVLTMVAEQAPDAPDSSAPADAPDQHPQAPQPHTQQDSTRRMQAIAILRMIDDPDEDYDTAIFEAERIVAFASGDTT